MKTFFWVAITTAALSLTACRYDNAEDLYTSAPCDTTNITFSGTIVPILATHCYSCHNEANYVSSGQSKLLEGYINVVDYVGDGSLLGSIKHQGGYAAMPDGAAKLSDCDIQKVELWINAGAPNN